MLLCLSLPHCSLGISKILGQLVVKYAPTYIESNFKKKRTAKDLSNDGYALFLCCCFFLLIFFIKACVVGTHLNCIDKSMQFKLVHTTYAFTKV